jgi:hypothetical protein
MVAFPNIVYAYCLFWNYLDQWYSTWGPLTSGVREDMLEVRKIKKII